MVEALGAVPPPLSLAAAGLISLPPACSDCISELTWAAMVVELVLALEVVLALVVSQGGFGAVGPVGIVLAEEALAVRVPPLSSWAPAPALSKPTDAVSWVVLEDTPALDEYQEFRTERSIEPMPTRAEPPTHEHRACRAFTFA